jgi:NADH-quinone oxidoreductase subunit N
MISLLPESCFLAVILVLFCAVLIAPDRKISLAFLPWMAGALAAASALSLSASGTFFGGAYVADPLSQFFKLAVAVGFLITVLNAMRQPTLHERLTSDYFLLLSLSAFGLMLLSSAVELMTIYIALEISSYSLFALVPLRARNPQAAEAGIKYILFGAALTGLSLFGYSFILAGQHTGYLPELVHKVWSVQDNPLAVTGLCMFLFGFLFKLALFPFHFWCPDVYEGASNETAAFVATLPKLGAMAVLIRLGSMFHAEMTPVMLLAVLGALSMTYGNLTALVQSDVKRMLGYSSVSHAGYIIIGLVAGTAQGLGSAAFYSLVYVLMNLACFWVICRVAVQGRNVRLSDLDGLAQKSPVLALVLAVAAFSLVGLPPTGGFMGKLFLFTSAWNRGFNWLIIIGALNSAISIYYYLSLVRHAYTHEPQIREGEKRPVGLVWGGVLALAVLLLGVFPGPVYDWALRAGTALMP